MKRFIAILTVLLLFVVPAQADTFGTDGSKKLTVTNGSGASAVNIQDGGNIITVDGTVNAAQSGTWNVTNVSGTVSLPTGAATAAKQPALGTAGAASADVITVQGVASMTPVQVDHTKIGGNTVSTGNGTAGTGTQRVTISSDNTAFPVNATSTGDVAHDGVDSGNPVKQGFQAKTSLPTAVADADRVNGIADKFGRQVVLTNAIRDIVGSQNTTITSSTSETTIVTAGGAGVFIDLTHLAITNKSATGTLVTLKDSTAGTTRGVYYVPATGGIVLTFPTPKAQASANNNWTLTCGTSVDSVYVTAEFINNK